MEKESASPPLKATLDSQKHHEPQTAETVSAWPAKALAMWGTSVICLASSGAPIFRPDPPPG